MPNPKIFLYVVDFFKTLNTKLKPNLLSRDTGVVANNLRYDIETGSLQKRDSRAKYNSVGIASYPVHSLHRYYKNSTGSAALITGFASAIKVGYDAAGVLSDIKTGITSLPLTFQTYKDLEYIFNGSDNNQVFTFLNQTKNVEEMGVPSLISSPSGTVSAAVGNLGNGSYYYVVAQQLDGYQEGNAGPSSAGTNPNKSQMTVSIPTSTNTRCTGYYLYRTRSTASTLYYLAFVSGSVTKTYVDNIADTSLDITRTAPIDYGTPASYKYPALHKERLFLANNKDNKSRIIFSDIRSGSSYPDVFPVNNRLDIGKDDGDEITAIKTDNFGHLVVFKKNSVRIINTTQDAPAAWNISDPYTNQGCIAPFSAAVTPIGIIYLTRYGEQRNRLVLWNGRGTQVIPQLEGIEPILTDIPDTALDEVRGHYHNGYYYLSYRDSSGAQVFSNRVLVVDIYTWSVEIDKKNVACFCSWNGGNDRGELYTGASNKTGFIYREDTSSYDSLIRYKSELDEGTYSQAASLGTETTPSIMLTSDVANDVGAKTWASLSGTDTWADYTVYNQTWWLSGQWLDTVRDIAATAFTQLYWNEASVANTDIAFWIRTGESVVACQAAGWNGPYTTADGSDISAVSGAKYVQLRANLYTQTYSTVSGLSIARSGTLDTDYVIKIAANFGSPAETTIEFDWKSGRRDLGDVNEIYKRLRKRIRSVRVEYEAGSSTGSFDFEWYLNGSVTRTGMFNTSYTTYSQARTYNFPLSTFGEDFAYRIYSNTDVNHLKIKKVVFTINAEPFAILRKNL